MGLVAACLASKLGSVLPVGAFAVATLGTSTRRVAGVDLLDHDARDLRLVRQEVVELCERPAGEPVASVGAPGRNPVADAFEIFDGDTTPGASGFLDDLFQGAMVFVAAEAGFLPGDTPQLLAGAIGPLSLEPSPLEVVLAADVVDGLARVGLPIRVGGDLGQAHVHAEEVVGGEPGAVGDVDRHQQEPLAVLAVDKITLT